MSSHNPLFFPIRPRSLTYSLYPLAMDLRRLHPRLCINSRPRTRSAGDGLRRHPLCTLSLSEGGHFKNLKSLSRPQARKRSLASRRPAPRPLAARFTAPERLAVTLTTPAGASASSPLPAPPPSRLLLAAASVAGRKGALRSLLCGGGRDRSCPPFPFAASDRRSGI
jgi:hypothetical protein